MTSLSAPSPCHSRHSTLSSRAGTLARSCATSSRWSRPLRSTSAPGRPRQLPLCVFGWFAAQNRENCRKPGALVSIAGIWLVALGLCSPYAIFVEFHPRDLLMDGGQQDLRCDETWNDNGRFTFSMLGLVLQYATPLVVIVYCYVAVCLKLRSQKTASKGEILLINLSIINSNWHVNFACLSESYSRMSNYQVKNNWI